MSLRQQNKLKARANILSAAESLIAEHGIQAAKTRDIAKAAGVSYQTLYNYFPTKADIARGILESELEHFGGAADNVTKHYNGDLVSSLVEFLEICLEAVERTGKDLWAFVATQALANEIQAPDLSALFKAAHEHYYALLNQARGRGDLVPDADLHLLALALFNLTDYAMLRYFLEPIDNDRFLDTQRQIFSLVVNPYLRSE